MQVIELSKDGITPGKARLVAGQRGFFYALLHGEEGRGRWQYRLPLGTRDFPASQGGDSTLSLDGVEIDLISIGRKDARGNDMYVAVRAKQPDGRFLVLWRLSPGYRGGAEYKVEGQAEVIALGQEAQGDAGRMGCALCPIVLVGPGPAVLRWSRSGRLYGGHPDWVAIYDGDGGWAVAPEHECALEEAALTA